MTEDDACYEGYQYIVTDAEEAILGEVPMSALPFPDEPSGEPWDEDDDEVLAKRFPRLHAKHSR